MLVGRSTNRSRTGSASARPFLPPRLLAAAILSALVSNPALAGDIYRWVDEKGVVHYSDTRPHEGVPVEVVEIEASQSPDYDPVADPYSILNQASRLHENWLDFEAARQSRAQERLGAMTVTPRTSPRGYPPHGYYGYSIYPYYPVSPGPGPGYRPGYRREQVHALNTLDLLGPRPQSINSGTHYNRVTRSQFLPIVPPPIPPPRPDPR
jgi:hypothetical protein